jgi:hypothetical protein
MQNRSAPRYGEDPIDSMQNRSAPRYGEDPSGNELSPITTPDHEQASYDKSNLALNGSKRIRRAPPIKNHRTNPGASRP